MIDTTTMTGGVPKRSPFMAAVSIVFLGLALAVAALGLHGIVNSGRFPKVEYWWLLTLAPAFVILALSWRNSWRMAGVVMASFFAGLAVQIALKDPFWFQHVRVLPDPPILYLMAASLALQGLAAIVVIWRRGVLGKLPATVSDLGFIKVLAVLAILAVLSASAMQQIALGEPASYVRQLMIGLVFLGLNIASFIALLAACPDQGLKRLRARMNSLFSLPGEHTDTLVTPADRALPRILASGLVIICALIAFIALEAVPHLDDITYRFQARYLADGQVALPVPAGREAFDIYLMDEHDGRWFATTFPGWPAILALGQTLGVELWITPVLGGLGILLLHRVVTDAIDRGTAHIAAVLMAISPWYVGTSSNPLIHTFTAVLILGCWALLLKTRHRPSVLLPFMAGLLMGLMFLTRPLEGLLIGTLSGLALLPLLRDFRHIRTIIAYGLGCLALAWLIFPYNAYLTGDAFANPLNTYYDHFWGQGANALGFGENRGAVPNWGAVDALAGHSPLESLINAHQNLHEINSSFLGWGGASLAFVLIYIFWGRWTRFTQSLALICVATFGLYTQYRFYGGYYAGARYWFMMLIPLIVFTALGIRTATERGSVLFSDEQAGARLGVGVGFLSLASVLIFVSWIAINRYPGINDYHADYKKLAEMPEFENTLVFINNHSEKEYGSAYWLNDFNPEATTPLFAKNLGPDTVREIAQAWPERSLIFVDGRENGEGVVTVTRGPLTLSELEGEGF